MTITSSLGETSGVTIYRSLSGYTFVTLSVKMATYSDSPTFTLTSDAGVSEYTVVGSETYGSSDGPFLRVNGLLTKHLKWLDVVPMSLDSAEASDILSGMGIENGPKVPLTLLNLQLTYGQLAVLLSNVSPKTALVDFNEERVVCYSDLYKVKPALIQVPFRRIYSRAPIAGRMGWDTLVSGEFPKNAQTIIPFGNYTNIDETTMGNVTNNCNELSKLFSDMQVFTSNQALDLGSTVLSTLTHDKKVIVAVEEQDSFVYYCI